MYRPSGGQWGQGAAGEGVAAEMKYKRLGLINYILSQNGSTLLLLTYTSLVFQRTSIDFLNQCIANIYKSIYDTGILSDLVIE